ncbi:MAG: glutaredoxin family protein [Syntrophaceae bacterium]|nr:glutaredoxin family protein [Syntrophaceae bacterium]
MTKYLFFITVLFLFIFGLITANAEYYTWEDETGVTHITNHPPPQTVTTTKVQVRKFESGEVSVEEEETATAPEIKPNIILYTKNECPDCNKAREFLQSQNIAFTEHNMDNDPEIAAQRKKIDDSEDVPFAIINRNHVYGFSESVYNRAMKIAP